MAETPRTLHLNTEPGYRGGEVQTLGLVRELERAGRTALLLARPGGALLDRARAAAIPARPFRLRGEWDLLAAMRLRAIAQDEGIALVHAHTAHTLTAALAARALGGDFAVVASRRVSFPLRSALSRAKYRRADAVIAVSAAIRETLLADGLAPEQLYAVHSGVDLARFANLPDREATRKTMGIERGRYVVGVVAALEHHKGHGTMLEAFNLLWRDVPGALLLLVGEGKRRREIAHHAEARGIPIHFAGNVAEPAPLYPAMDLLVLPSVSGEGSPGVIKEAAAGGVPVVATDVSGTREILRDGLEALLVPPRDRKALGLAMRRVATDPLLSAALTRAARERVREFSLEATARKTWAVYTEVLARRGRPAAGSFK